MNYTLINAEHNFDTHISTATISTDIGLFTATTRCHKEDIPYESKYFGCRLAEWKALRMHAKAKRREALAALNALMSFAVRMGHTKNYQPTDYYVKQLWHEIEVARSKVEKWERDIDNINTVIATEVMKHSIAIERFKNGN
jgi:hypothetical protein